MTKVQALTHNIVQNHTTQRVIFRALVASLIVLAVAYAYLIGSITFHVLARKSLETTVRTLGSHISSMELTYLAEANKIDKNYALSLGFVEIHDNIFAARGSAATRVALK